MITEKSKLGRGLSALLGDISYDSIDSGSKENLVKLVDLRKITPNSHQPRKEFEPNSLKELALSIKQKGIISPIIARESSNDQYEIIAGERRYRAAQIVGLQNIPVIVKNSDDVDSFEIALIENLQRKNLNAVEEARAYQNLIDKYSHTQSDVAKIVGKSRSYIANMLRLLALPEFAIELLAQNKINVGHAKTIVGQPNAKELVEKIITKGLNVRQVENMIYNKNGSAHKIKEILKKDNIEDDIKVIESILSQKLGVSVRIKARNQRSGNIFIEYESLQDLDKLLQVLSK